MEQSTKQTDWEKCILCKAVSKVAGKLICPASSKKANCGAGYKTFINDITYYNSFVDSPNAFDIEGLGNTSDVFQLLFTNKAKWHNKCRLKYTKQKVYSLLSTPHNEPGTSTVDFGEPEASSSLGRKRSIRQVGLSTEELLERNRTECMFCEKGSEYAHLKGIQTEYTQDQIRTAATLRNDARVKSILEIGDLFAQEKHYHLNCYLSFVRVPKEQNSLHKEQASRWSSVAFAEVTMYMEEHSNHVFDINNIIDIYKEAYCNISKSTEPYVNVTLFTQRLLDNIHGLHRVKSGKQVVLSFDETLSSLVSTSSSVGSDKEMETFFRAAQIIRKDIFKQDSEAWSSKLEFFENQEKAICPKLLTFIQMLISGKSSIQKGQQRYQESLTISQIISRNTVKRSVQRVSSKKRYTASKETPVTDLIGHLVYQYTRSRNLVDTLYNLGVSTSYTKVIELSEEVTASLIEYYQNKGLVCPPVLQNNTYTMGAIDNIDHNPSSTTSTRSFHGTGISLFQNNPIEEVTHRPVLDLNTTVRSDDTVLQEYLFVNNDVPSSHKLPSPVRTEPTSNQEHCNVISEAIEKEKDWLKEVDIHMGAANEEDVLTWPAFHARQQASHTIRRPSISCMLPLLDAPSMGYGTMRHAIDTLVAITAHLNPGQKPVIAVDLPLFQIAMHIKWTWPIEYDNCIFMMGGLHMEMEQMRTLGSLLNESGWTHVLSKAGICGPGTADSFLKATHVTRTRHAHQVTACCLWILQHDKYEAEPDEIKKELSFGKWCELKSEQSTHFYFWNMILKYEMLLLSSVRAVRETQFDTYIELLKECVPLFFALDKIRYAKWTSIYIHDMEILKEKSPDDYTKLSENFTVQKTNRAFSAIAIDQAHEQNNQIVKGSLNVISLMETPSTLLRWSLSSPVLQSSIHHFEEQISSSQKSDDIRHHDDNEATNKQFYRDVEMMLSTFIGVGNPFSESLKLHSLDTAIIAHPKVEDAMKRAVDIGNEQYSMFMENKLQTSNQNIDERFKLNGLKRMSSKIDTSPNPSTLKIKNLRDNYGLFTSMMFACQQRKVDLNVLFQHENRPHPPSISDKGQIRVSKTKADLVPCLTTKVDASSLDVQSPPTSSCLIVDGAAMAHAVCPKGRMTYQEYATTEYWRRILHTSSQHSSTRIDVVFDRYLTTSIKSTARSNRGKSSERQVSVEIDVPKNWNTFLLNDKNKEQLFQLLASNIPCTENEVYATKNETVVSNQAHSFEDVLYPCNHEEADTRMFLHVRHAASLGHKEITLRSADTDVIVIAVSLFNQLDINKLWILKNSGNKTTYIPVHDICASLAPSTVTGLLYFHAYTGCDTVSAFSQVGKRTAWNIADDSPSVWQACSTLSNFPQSIDRATFAALERFTVLLYDKKK